MVDPQDNTDDEGYDVLTTSSQYLTTFGSGVSGSTNNTVILAASVGGTHIRKLAEPIVIRFKHKQQGGVSPSCVFWDFSAGKDGGAWSSRGCRMTSHVEDQYTVCECDHMTNFALLLDIYGERANLSEGHKKALNLISYIGCAISLAALVLTIIAYSVSRKLHKDNPSKLLINLCVSLSMVLILFIVVTQPAVWGNTIACKATAGLLHYFLLSTWTWMAVEAFYMYLTLIKIFKTYISKFILKSCLVGWGVPAIIVVITVAIDTDNYGPNGDICWLTPIPFYAACLTPICIVLLANFVVFAMVLHQLRRISIRQDHRSMKHYGIKTQLRGAVAVMVLLGLTWVFAIFAVGRASVAFQYLFCIFNSLQGLFIFIFYCFMKKDVKDIWREKWTEFTSASSDRSGHKGKYPNSRGSIPNNSTLTTDSPRISQARRTEGTILTASTEEHLHKLSAVKQERSPLADNRYD